VTDALGSLDVPKASDWRSWLSKHHASESGVWLVFHKKDSGLPTISYDDALDEALAFGWIDSIIRKIDERSYARKFTPRKPMSIWSTSNITRVERLKKEGRMSEKGLEAFARRTGEKSLLEKFDQADLAIPKDFEAALGKNKRAQANFQRFGPSYRKRYLLWISAAKKAETRKKRIGEAVNLISKNVKNLLK